MKNTYFFIILFFLFSFTKNAQATSKTGLKKPVSIYSVSNVLNSKNSFSAIKKKLNNLNFVFVDLINLDTNTFSLNFNDLGKNPSAYIYNDNKKYRDENLLKGFLEKNDPTRWNLQCPQPSLHPYN